MGKWKGAGGPLGKLELHQHKAWEYLRSPALGLAALWLGASKGTGKVLPGLSSILENLLLHLISSPRREMV